MKSIYLDYNSIGFRLDAIADEMKKQQYDGLVIVLRGGLFCLNFHMSVLRDRQSFFLSMSMPAPFLKNRDAYTLHVGPLYPLRSASDPDYYCFDLQDINARFLLAWARGRINPIADLDVQVGFCDDVKIGTFCVSPLWCVVRRFAGISLPTRNLEETLTLRDQLSLAPPTLNHKDIITAARPEYDRFRTEQWLSPRRYKNPVVFRHDHVHQPTHKSVPVWTGQLAMDLGVTHYSKVSPFKHYILRFFSRTSNHLLEQWNARFCSSISIK